MAVICANEKKGSTTRTGDQESADSVRSADTHDR